MPSHSHISDRSIQQMAAWYSQRPSFAMMGEFSSGKSTLLNLLIGQPLLPTKVTVTKLPVIWITHGTSPSCIGLTHDGKLEDLDSAQPDPTVWDAYLLVRMTLDAPMLTRCDVIDTPGISDPRLAIGSMNFITEYIDFAIWCTAANQAWRQSEKAAWKALSKGLDEDNILAVTRADQLGGAADLRKVLKRVTSETTGMFREICPIATPNALAASDGGRLTNAALWHESGAQALLSAIKQSIARAKKACDARETVVVPAEMPAMPAPAPQPDAPRISQEKQEVPEVGDDTLSTIRTALSQSKQSASKNTVLATIGQLRDALLNDYDLDDAHADVLAACLSVNDLDALDHLRVLVQVEQEFEDFAKSAWCRLA